MNRHFYCFVVLFFPSSVLLSEIECLISGRPLFLTNRLQGVGQYDKKLYLGFYSVIELCTTHILFLFISECVIWLIFISPTNVNLIPTANTGYFFRVNDFFNERGLWFWIMVYQKNRVKKSVSYGVIKRKYVYGYLLRRTIKVSANSRQCHSKISTSYQFDPTLIALTKRGENINKRKGVPL